jgi:type II secretory pathway pseudopilin PulG
MRYTRRNSSRRPQAFSLVEILVVVSVLVLLVGILVPSLENARRVTRIKTTESLLGTIEGGLSQLKNDTRPAAPPDGFYPPSSDGMVKDNEPWKDKVPNDYKGRHLLTVFLIGWPEDEGDDNKPSSNITEDDGANGWGVRFNSRGRIYGPYNGLQDAPVEKDGDRFAFVDPFGNEVYYYRYDDRTGEEKYHEDHNTDEDHHTDGPSQAYLDQLEKSRRDYILITAGPDGEFGDPTGSDSQKEDAKDNIGNVD